MTQYVVHKIGFFYTDECYAPYVDEREPTFLSKVFRSRSPLKRRGSVLAIHNTLESAQKAKHFSDIKSMKKQGGNRASDFFFDAADYDEILSGLKAYYDTQEWPLEDEDFFELPESMTDENAVVLLKVMRFTFHEIVEYEDDFEIKKKNYGKLPDCDEF